MVQSVYRIIFGKVHNRHIPNNAQYGHQDASGSGFSCAKATP